jgi:hypothetical protein
MEFINKLQTYRKAGFSGIFVLTHEESRLSRDIINISSADNKVSIVEWDAQNGLIHRGGPEVAHPDGTQISTDLLKYLQAYKHEKTIFVLRDFHLHFDKVINIRMLRNAWNPLKSKGNMIVFVGHKYAVPGELQKEIQLMDYDLPDSKAIEERLLFIKNSANVSREKKGMPLVEIPEEIVDSAIEAAKGMTDAEVENAFSMAYISSGNFDNKFVETVFQEKIAQLKKNGFQKWRKFFGPPIE